MKNFLLLFLIALNTLAFGQRTKQYVGFDTSTDVITRGALVLSRTVLRSDSIGAYRTGPVSGSLEQWNGTSWVPYLKTFSEVDPLAILKTGLTTLSGNVTVNGANNFFRYQNTRVQWGTGATVAAANNLTLGNDGNTFPISGNTQINAITTTNWQAGSVVNLVFSGTPTLKHNTAGAAGTAVLDLAGDVDWTPAAGDVVSFLYDGTQWRETTRKMAGAAGGKGSVTNVSVATANGFKGTVSNANTTPSINMQVNVTGLLKGSSTTGVVSAAVAGTDYAAASHTHAASDIVSGILAPARIASGTATAGFVPTVQSDGSLAFAAQSGGGTTQTTAQQTLTADGTTNAFTFTSVPATYSDYAVFRNGVLLDPTTDYTASGNTVTLVGITAKSNDLIQLRRYK